MKMIRLLFGLIILGIVGFIILNKPDTKLNSSQAQQDNQSEEGIKLNPSATKIALISNTTNNSVTKTLVGLIKDINPAAVAHIGNLGIDGEANFSDSYKDIFDFNKKEFLPAIGEQDLDLVDATKKEFNLKKTYYSRNFKNIHLVALDSNLLNDDANKAEMLNWLRTDLSKLKKSQVSVVYFFHSPVTSASLHKPSETSLREITPILDEYLVDFVITAENHNYQRSCPLNLTGISEVCTSPGSLYIVSGGGGAPLQGFTGTREEIIRQRVKAYHFVLIEVDGQNIHLRAIDTEGKTIDDIELKKKI